MSLKLGLASLLLVAGCASSTDEAATTSAAATENGNGEATVHFSAGDWTPTWTGDVTAGGSLTIDYDFDRLPQCRNQSTLDSWVVEVNWRFDGGRTHTIALPGSPGAGSTSDTIEIPSTAKSIELWFENHAVGGYDNCAAFDSQFGANYVHTL